MTRRTNDEGILEIIIGALSLTLHTATRLNEDEKADIREAIDRVMDWLEGEPMNVGGDVINLGGKR